MPPPVVYEPLYGNGGPPTNAVYGLLREAPSGTPVALVFELMFVKVRRVDHGWKFVIVFHSLPEMLP